MTKFILIIEDDLYFAQALNEALTELGYIVMTSGRPSDALVKLKNQKFNCVLLDLQLPGSSGIKVMQQMRGTTNIEPLNMSTPIILMSGHLEVESVKAAAGKVQAVLAKPFDLSSILAKVQQLAG